MTLYLTDTTPPDEMRARARPASSPSSSTRPAPRPTATPASPTCARPTATLEAMQREGLLAAGARRGDRSGRSTCSIARRCSSSAHLIAAAARLSRAEDRVRAHHDAARRAQYVRRGRTRTPRRRSPRITCSTTATRSSPAACGRTTTACRCSSARSTGSRWSRRRPSGSADFFLGTDSAPHAAALKEHASGCAGCYTALAALELYAEAFDAAGALDRLEGIRELPRRRLLRPAAQRRHGHLAPRGLDAARERCPSATRELKPLRGGETAGLEARV